MTEHWMSDVEISSLSMEGFNTIGFSARKNHTGGGTVIFVREGLQANVKKFKMDFNIEKCIEYSCVYIKDFNVYILALYRSPSGHFDTFLANMESLLCSLGASKRIILAGDFNVHFGTKKPNALRFSNMLTGFGMQQTVMVPTRQNACLDNVLVGGDMDVHHVEVINLDISDHLGQIVTLSIMSNINIPGTLKKKLRPITQKGLFLFHTKLSNFSWDFIDNTDAERTCERFVSVLNEAYNECFPEGWYAVRPEGGVSWFSQELRAMREHLRFLGEVSRQYNTLENKACYNKYKTKYKRAIRKAKIFNNDSHIKNSANPIKSMWQIIQKTVGNCKAKNRDADNLNSNDFNNFFSNIAYEIAHGLPESDVDPMDNLGNIAIGPTFLVSEVSFNKVRETISHLKNKNSRDIYGFNVRVIKSVVNVILIPLTKIINLCIRNKIFPKCMKRALVIPVFKKGNIEEAENYRPISLLPIISKIFEKVIAEQIVQFFESNNLFTKQQFGFRKNKNTTLGILNLVSDIMDAFDDQGYDAVLFCDLSKAFDCVDHGILLQKLGAYNFQEDTIELLKSYLTDRFQAVKYGGVLSDEREIRIGVPQGSILGPILFLIYVNDLPLIDQSSNYTLFADDTTISVVERTLETALRGSRDAQLRAESWFISNKLLLNQDKTERIIFTLRDLGAVNGSVYQTKFLGVNIDYQAQWNAHLEAVALKLNKSLFLLRRLADNISGKALKSAYFATFHSQLSYAVLVWGHAPNSKYLFGLQRKAIRVVAGLGFRDDCRGSFKQLGILTLPSLYLLENLLYVVGNIDLFATHGDVHTYQTRNKTNLIPARWRLKRCQSGPGYWGIKYFNVLPPNIRELPVIRFKQVLKKILIDNAFYSHDEYFQYFST